MYSLGRLEIPDSRDADYPLSAVLPALAPTRTYRYWNDTQWWGDQGSRPWCVAYAWLHWLEDGPVTHKLPVEPAYPPSEIYHRAQQIDQWPGENYDGTSVRAGAKALVERNMISAYHWAWEVSVLTYALLTTGPVVLGTRWYQGMFQPDQDYFLHPTGNVAGGHAYVLNGVNVEKERFRVKNSWGRNWGNNGRAWMSFETVQKLLNEQGEACMAMEIKTGA